jgi:hypothetical protein
MGFFGKNEAADTIEPSRNVDTHDPEKGSGSRAPSEKDNEEVISSNAQAGVKKVEAATIVWTKWQMIAAYGM